MLLAILMGESLLILVLLAGAAVLYLAASRRFRELEEDNRQLVAAQAALRKTLDSRIDRLEETVREFDTAPVPTASESNALSMQKRSQALKMIRRGEPPETVAATLGVPRNQIQLLLKVQNMITS